MKTVNVIFFSHIYPEEQLEYFSKITNNSLAGMAVSNYEEGFIYLFSELYPKIKIINHPFVQEYPKLSRSFFVKKFSFTLNKLSCTSIGYCTGLLQLTN